MIRAWWHRQRKTKYHSNWGDILTPAVVRGFTGSLPERSRLEGKYLIVGSILRTVRAGDIVWGAGMLDPDLLPDPFPKDVTFLAVRGPLSRQALLDRGQKVPELYGDPGLLAPYLIPTDEPEVQHDIGLIPHYMDQGPLGYLKDVPGVHVINIRAGLKKVVLEVRSCARIVSSTLHGVILGDAYQKPTAWLRVDGAERLTGGDFKFRDYLLSTGREPVATDLTSSDPWPTTIRWLDSPTIDLDPLVQACPFNPRGYRTPADLLGTSTQTPTA